MRVPAVLVVANTATACCKTAQMSPLNTHRHTHTHTHTYCACKTAGMCALSCFFFSTSRSSFIFLSWKHNN